ncbi:MAG: S8 family peptidase [Muribaculaceae bacterium]|nr:S8 family peptidase [Muribaculaceae bacterium]
MKKIFIGTLCIAAALTAQADRAKISTAGQMLMMERQQSPSRSEQPINALVRLADGYSFDELAQYPVLATFGEQLAIVELTPSEIETLSDKEFIENISFGETAQPCLDIARKDAQVDQVQQGIDINSPYNGKGIIAGIFDTGIDPNHITFMGKDGKTRVQRFYNLDAGRIYTAETVVNATTDNASKTHGTHCAGIMGGAYGGAGKIVGTKKVFGRDILSIIDGDIPYYGVAREADLYLSGGSLYNDNILLACNKIADYAIEQGKPVVINLSLGSVTGSHDGTSDFDEAIDAIAAKGALIFVAAGNEGTDNMSIKKTFTATDNTIKTFPVSQGGATKQLSTQVEFWANNNGTLTFTLGLYNKTTGEIVNVREINTSKTQSATIAGTAYPQYEHNASFNATFSNDSYIIMNTGVWSKSNRAYIKLSTKLTYQSGANMAPVFIVKGNAGQTVLATIGGDGEFTSNNLAGFDNGSPDNVINDMATAKGVIAIGAYTTRLSWYVFNNNNPTTVSYNGYNESALGQVSDFSSSGTTFDGINLPHVCAPGMGIISSYSTPYMEGAGASEKSYICAQVTANGRNNYWLCEQGTSMATPFAAGTVALWLQAKPELTRNEVIELFNKTSVRDAQVLAGNPVKWGAGKLNALNGIKEILNSNGVGTIYDNEDLRLIVTTDNGKQFSITVGSENGFTARLYSLSGSLVKTDATSGSQMELDASDLNSGIYILEIAGETARYTRKITVK